MNLVEILLEHLYEINFLLFQIQFIHSHEILIHLYQIA